MKSEINYLKISKIVGIVIVASVLISSLFKIMGAALPYYYKDLKVKEDIEVTGYYEQHFKSDLIVWEASFQTTGRTLKDANKKMDEDKKRVERFLANKGVKKDEITFQAVNRENKYRYEDIFNNDGDFTRSKSIFDYYIFRRTLVIKSTNVDLIESISNDITDLINQGVVISSYSPKYYYTKKQDLKISTIEKASEDGLERAKTTVEGGGGELGDLLETSIGIFQILGKNSDDSFSYGGTLNTADKEKTISISVKQRYAIK